MQRPEYRFGRFRLRPAERELWRDDAPVALPRRVFDCLLHLIEHRDRAIGRDELVDAVWGRANVSDVQLAQIVLRARRAVDDDGQAQQRIRTVPGFGYHWIAEVDVVDTAQATERAADSPAPRAVNPRIADAGGTSQPSPAAREVSTPAAAPRVRSPAVWIALATAALVAVIVGMSWWRSTNESARVGESDAVLAQGAAVLPLAVRGPSSHAWLRLGAMDLVAQRLRDAGLRVPPSENVVALLQQSGEGAATLRTALGTPVLVDGDVEATAGGWRATLRASDGADVALRADAEDEDAVQAVRRAADQLLAALGFAAPGTADGDGAHEALQRARAAMLANELDAARAILQGSPALSAAPLEARFALAQVQFRAGELRDAEQRLQALLRDAAEAPPEFRARVLTALGATRVRRGEFARAGEDYAAAVALLPQDADPATLGHALAGRGVTRVAAERFDAALADLGAARVHLETGGDALGVARLDANLGMLELYRRRPGQALPYLESGARRLREFGALHEWLLALTGQIDAQLQLLEREAAWAGVERAWAARERITDPLQWIDLLLNRAEVLMGAGRYREAGALLADPRVVGTDDNVVLRARARVLRAQLAQATGEPARAVALAREALAQWPEQGVAGERERVLLLMQRALLALEREDEAAALIERSTTVPPTFAAGEAGAVHHALTQAEWYAVRSDLDIARRWYDVALDAAETGGIPADQVDVATSYAPLLFARGDQARALAVIGRVAPWSAVDFDSALLQLRAFHHLGQTRAWAEQLARTRQLAGEREIPAALQQPPGTRLGNARS